MHTAEVNAARFNTETRACLPWFRVGATSLDDADGVKRTLDRYLWALQRIEEAGSESTEVNELELLSACAVLAGNLMDWRDQARALTAVERGLLEAWPTLLMRNLERPDDDQTHADIAQYLTDPAWSMSPSTLVTEDQDSMLQAPEEAFVATDLEVEDMGIEGSGSLAHFPGEKGLVRLSRAEIEDLLASHSELEDAGIDEPGAGGEETGFEQSGSEAFDFAVETTTNQALHASDACAELPQTHATDLNLNTNANIPLMAGHEAALDRSELDASPMGLTDASPADQRSSQAENEFVQLLRDELAASADAMTEMLVTMAAPDAEQTLRTRALGDYLEYIDRLAMAAEAMGLAGLRLVFTHVQINLPAAGTESYDI